MAPHRSSEIEQEIRRLRARGYSFRQIARKVGYSDSHTHRVCTIRDVLPPETHGWVPAPDRLSMREREEIRAGLERKETRCRARSLRTVDGCAMRHGVRTSVPISGHRSEEHTSELQSLMHLVCR